MCSRAVAGYGVADNDWLFRLALKRPHKSNLTCLTLDKVNSGSKVPRPHPEDIVVDGWLLRTRDQCWDKAVKKILKASPCMKILRTTLDNIWPSDC